MARKILQHLGLLAVVPAVAPARLDEGDLWQTGPPAFHERAAPVSDDVDQHTAAPGTLLAYNNEAVALSCGVLEVLAARRRGDGAAAHPVPGRRARERLRRPARRHVPSNPARFRLDLGSTSPPLQLMTNPAFLRTTAALDADGLRFSPGLLGGVVPASTLTVPVSAGDVTLVPLELILSSDPTTPVPDCDPNGDGRVDTTNATSTNPDGVSVGIVFTGTGRWRSCGRRTLRRSGGRRGPERPCFRRSSAPSPSPGR